MPALTSSPEAPAPSAVAPPPGTPAPPGTPVAAVSNPTQANGLVPLVDKQGQPLAAEKLMNWALEIYVENMGNAPPTDMNELVRAKVLQSIPAPPPGKKWAFDPKQGKIVLAGQ